jgi:hypothetical protein
LYVFEFFFGVLFFVVVDPILAQGLQEIKRANGEKAAEI